MLKKISTKFSFAVIAILSLNIAIFWRHYAGLAIFTDDFLHLYHSPSFAWYADHSIFSPGTWTAYGNLGYPTSLSLQSGAFYIPLVILDLLGVPYTLENATRFQAIHTLFAGFGAYAFFGNHTKNRNIVLLAALAYMTSAIFVGNQQHVDVIRGSALLPWVLFLSSSNWLDRGRLWRVGVLALVGGFFLIGSYPGIVASAVMAIGIAVAFEWLTLKGRQARLRYFSRLVVGWAVAALAALVKYGPPLLQSSEMLSTGGAANVYGLVPQFVLTLIMPFGNPNLGGDISLRSLYVAPVFLAALFFLKRCSHLVWFGGIFIAIFLIFSPQNEGWQNLVQIVPGQSLSRMKMFDFRPILAVGIILLGVASLDEMSTVKISQRAIFYRISMGVVLLVPFALASLWVGLTSEEVIRGAVPYMISLLGVGAMATFEHHRAATHLALVGLTAASALAFYNTPGHLATWVLEPPSFVADMMGVNLNDLDASLPRVSNWPARPARIAPADGIATFIDNRGYYTQEFSLLAIDGGNRLRRTVEYLAALNGPESGWLKPFVLAGSKTWRLSGSGPISADQLRLCAQNETLCTDGEVTMKEFSLDGAVYQIRLPAPMVLIENEVYYPGWYGQICQAGLACKPAIKSEPAAGILRSWSLPAGVFKLTTQFQDNTLSICVFAFWTALIITLGLLISPLFPDRLLHRWRAFRCHRLATDGDPRNHEHL